MPNYTLSFPILGNPDGRVMEFVTDDSEPPRGAFVTAMLNRYGDLFPRIGTVEVYETLTLTYFCDYTFLRPGEWALGWRRASDPRPSKNLRDLSPPI